jgi:hypothetical protein
MNLVSSLTLDLNTTVDAVFEEILQDIALREDINDLSQIRAKNKGTRSLHKK